MPRKTDAIAAKIVAALVKREQAAAVIIGLPVHANGDEGENVKWVRDFCRYLQPLIKLPIYEVDERHSSQEAEEVLRTEGKMARQTRRHRCQIRSYFIAPLFRRRTLIYSSAVNDFRSGLKTDTSQMTPIFSTGKAS